METTKKYNYNTFGELFEEIAFDFDYKYEPHIYYNKGIKYIEVYKTCFSSDGYVERKGNRSTFDPKLFWKVELMVKLLLDDNTLEVLYGSN